MKKALARLLLAFMLLWLPLQAYATQAMPFCQNHHAHAAALEEQAQHEGCHGHQAPSVSKLSLACDDCSSCHLMFQPALLFSGLPLAIHSSGTSQPRLTVSFSLFFPEQPQRPPLAILS